MKKILTLVLALIICIAPLAACGGEPQVTGDADTTTAAQPEDTTPTTEPSTFTVGFDASFPPYGYLDDTTGEYVGFDLDLAAEVCNRLGWTLVKKPIDWAAKDTELNGGSIDCIWNGFTITEERLTQYLWSRPYVDNSQVVVVKADSGITTLADLAGKTVAVQTASSAESVLNGDDMKTLKDSFKEVVSVGEYLTAFMNLDSGVADAIALDVGVAEYQLETRDGDYLILDEQLATEQYGIGFKLGNTDLADKVATTLDAMWDDGKFQEIAEKWDLSQYIIYGNTSK
jgi:polar amino acid transport system substrate-binding protein